jgi:hypothetical protein
MKVILQDYEPQVRPFGIAETRQPVVRKPRLRLNPVKADFRLFHAL